MTTIKIKSMAKIRVCAGRARAHAGRAAGHARHLGAPRTLVLETSGGVALVPFTCATPKADAVNGVRSPTLPDATAFSAAGTVARANLYKADGIMLIERYTAGLSDAEVIVSTVTAVTGAPCLSLPGLAPSQVELPGVVGLCGPETLFPM